MFGLIFKDFLMLRWYLGAGFLAGMSMTIVMRIYPSLFGLIAVWLTVWFVLARMPFYMDERAGSGAVINSLPLSKGDIVAGRHLASMVLLAYGFLVMLAGSLVLKLAGRPYPVSLSFSTIAAGLTLSGFMTICLFPALFKLDAMKARWLTFFVFAFFILPFIQISKSYSAGMAIRHWMDALFNLSKAWLLVVAVLVYAVLTGISVLVSVRLYRNREF